MNSTLGRAAALHTSNRVLEHRAKIDLQRVRDSKQSIDGGKPFAFLHAHDHRMTEAGASGDFIEGKLLPEPLGLNQFGQSRNNLLTLGSFRHIRFLCDEELDSGYDYRHNPRRMTGQRKNNEIPAFCGRHLKTRCESRGFFLPSEDQTDVMVAIRPLPMKIRCVALPVSLLLIGWPTVNSGKRRPTKPAFSPTLNTTRRTD